MDVDSRQKNADDCEAGEVLKACEQASSLVYTPLGNKLVPKASRLPGLPGSSFADYSRDVVVFRFPGNGRIVGDYRPMS